MDYKTYGDLNNFIKDIWKPGETDVDTYYQAALFAYRIQGVNNYFIEVLNSDEAYGIGKGSEKHGFVVDVFKKDEFYEHIAAAIGYRIKAAYGEMVELDRAKIFTKNKNGLVDNKSKIVEGEVLKFYSTYPAIDAVVETLVNNFKSFITEVCQRIIADRTEIEGVFLTNLPDDSNEYKLNKLVEISTTGPDTIKGGKQALLLEFNLKRTSAIKRFKFKLVYKPSDLEADCLIIGESDALKDVNVEFFQNNGTAIKSLMETLNYLNKSYSLNNLTFPTYRILPKNIGSTLGNPDGIYSIRESYGYIEFLHHNAPTGKFNPKLLRPKTGLNDYLIVDPVDGKEKAKTFWLLAGQLAAIAGTFSFKDLHHANLIVHDFLPYLIDLEASFSREIRQLRDTALVGGMEAGFSQSDPGSSKNLLIYDDPIMGERDVLFIDYPDQVKEGILNALSLLKQCCLEKDKTVEYELLGNWLDRVIEGNIIVRFLPSSPKGPKGLGSILTFGDPELWLTQEERKAKIATRLDPTLNLDTIIKEYEHSKVEGPYSVPNGNLNGGLKYAEQQAFDDWLEDWYSLDYFPLPSFYTVTPLGFSEDLKETDFPVYYHQCGSRQILNSWGKQIPIKAADPVEGEENGDVFITVEPEHYETQQAIKKYDEYFLSLDGQNNPTATWVRDSQLFGLIDDDYFTKRAIMMMNGFSLENPVEAVANFIPSNTTETPQ